MAARRVMVDIALQRACVLICAKSKQCHALEGVGVDCTSHAQECDNTCKCYICRNAKRQLTTIKGEGRRGYALVVCVCEESSPPSEAD